MDENVEIIGKKIIKDYILAFNNRDNYEMANLFNFPHIRFANESVSVISKNEYLQNQDKVTQLLKDEKWHHTDIKSIETIQSSPSKGHFKIHFLRFDVDGNITHDFKTLWIATKIKNHWGIQFRSSFLTSKAATFGKNLD
tara:strand:+ start:1348 stop:1767 length:420 start_codon:yes stop_codon:yes gene_type:complete